MRTAVRLKLEPAGAAAGAAVSADLATLARGAVRIIRHLDALNRIRFAEDPERLAEWVVARSLRWGPQVSQMRQMITPDGEPLETASVESAESVDPVAAFGSHQNAAHILS